MKKNSFKKIAIATIIAQTCLDALLRYLLGYLPAGHLFGLDSLAYYREWDIVLLPMTILTYERVLNFQLEHNSTDYTPDAAYRYHTIKGFINEHILYWCKVLSAAGFLFGALFGFVYGFCNALVMMTLGFLLIPTIFCVITIIGAIIALATVPLWKNHIIQVANDSETEASS